MTTMESQAARQHAPGPVQDISAFSKIQLIRKFQRSEGNVDCFASAYKQVCGQYDCLWRDECMARMKDAASLPTHD